MTGPRQMKDPRGRKPANVESGNRVAFTARIDQESVKIILKHATDVSQGVVLDRALACFEKIQLKKEESRAKRKHVAA